MKLVASINIAYITDESDQVITDEQGRPIAYIYGAKPAMYYMGQGELVTEVPDNLVDSEEDLLGYAETPRMVVSLETGDTWPPN